MSFRDTTNRRCGACGTPDQVPPHCTACGAALREEPPLPTGEQGIDTFSWSGGTVSGPTPESDPSSQEVASTGGGSDIEGTVISVDPPRYVTIHTPFLAIVKLMLVVVVLALFVRNLPQLLLGPLFVPLLVAVAVFWLAGRYLKGCLGAVFKVFLFLPILARRREQPAQYPVVPLRVRTANGTVVECQLPGELEGGSPRQGDVVRLRGRWLRRHRTLVVRWVRNSTTGAQTVCRVPWSVELDRYAGYALGAVSLAGVVWWLTGRGAT